MFQLMNKKIIIILCSTFVLLIWSNVNILVYYLQLLNSPDMLSQSFLYKLFQRDFESVDESRQSLMSQILALTHLSHPCKINGISKSQMHLICIALDKIQDSPEKLCCCLFYFPLEMFLLKCSKVQTCMSSLYGP